MPTSFKEQSPPPHTHIILGKEFVVYKDVFSPKHFPSTEFFISNIPFIKGEKFLDLGTGTGAIAIFAAINGAKEIVASDINDQAVKNATENVDKHSLTNIISVVKSDVFSNIDDKDFDTVFWNMPFMYAEVDAQISIYQRSFYDKQYQAIDRFFAEVRSHLNLAGKVLVGFSRDLGDECKLKAIFKKHSFNNIETLAEEKKQEEKEITISLFKVS